ncbi:NAD-dependent dehydratase [Secundilactobacillus oryzae JCM 18671]|uniref:NAD-dependent dehydratase n=1 Tax=Secundilactobacillus oryzae JCM 18671 TaxID=1291743 RepID=A0A081BGE1_9LACO|nr:SDR family oxidoreductase [Secundilactobacillus oryzae]GAK47109.1 NAD-dependent dehydratase [Secundilactobacillus oryzae JCM 18671]
MTQVLVLGANGQIAKLAEERFFADSDVSVRLFLRNASRLGDLGNKAEVIEGDVTDEAALAKAVHGSDVVYANLSGSNIEAQAKLVVNALHTEHVTRLIWISTLGIYDEVPGKFGKWNNQTLGSYITNYAAAAKVLEESDLDYTIIRPAWLTNKDEIDYETTQKGETFKGTEVSRKSVADFVYQLVKDPTKEIGHSVGLNKPNTDGDKPAWY